MPRPPPRPLCLPELVSNPQTRADFVLANPPKYGSSSSRSSSYSDLPDARAPPSPTSTNDAESHRTSGATLSSLTSPGTPASSRTSLSVHNLPWNGDAPKSPGMGGGLLSMSRNSSEGKAWSFGSINLGGAGTQATRQKPRTSWSSAFVNTKSWFGGAVTPEPAEASPSMSGQKEIKLSPSMIAASVSAQSISNRPAYPSVSDIPILSPTCSVDTTRPPKVGTGLQYYTERNPAPMHVRIQIPDPVDIRDHDPSQSSPPPPHQGASALISTLSTFSTHAKELPVVPDVTVCVPSPTLHLTALKDTDMLRGENPGPLSPPPTPPVHERESNVPRIRVSSGEDL